MGEIINFWKDIEYYKRVGLDELIKKIDKKKYKKNITYVNISDIDKCLID